MMSESILALLETTPAGDLTVSAAELLGAAGRLGDPVAVIAVTAGADAAALTEAAASLGAAQVITVTTETADPVVGLADALTRAAEQVPPGAVLVSHGQNGREAAARFAIRTKRAILVDAVGVDRDDEGVIAHHSVFGGSYQTDSAVTIGAPVITIRQGSVEDRVPAATPTVTALDAAEASAPVATVTSFEPAAEGGERPDVRRAKKIHFELVRRLYVKK
jgi:electron transfer flavoprotein alpha subunit